MNSERILPRLAKGQMSQNCDVTFPLDQHNLVREVHQTRPADITERNGTVPANPIFVNSIPFLRTRFCQLIRFTLLLMLAVPCFVDNYLLLCSFFVGVLIRFVLFVDRVFV